MASTSVKATTSAMICFLALGAVAGRAAITHDLVPDADYVAHGLSGHFDAVGALQIEIGGQTLVSSGVLIDPSWVLITAHQVAGSDGFGAGIDEVRFTTGPDALNPLSVSVGNQVVRHPDWNPADNDWNQVDVALVRLDHPLHAVPYAVRYRGDVTPGDILSYAGYGTIGAGSTGPVSFDGLRRGWENQIVAYGGDPAREYAAPWHAISNFDLFPHLPLEGILAPGDSGGGGFVNLGGRMELALISDSVFDSWTYDNDFLGTRLSLFNDWIDSVVPEPGTLGLVLAGVLVVTRRRLG